MMMLKNKFLVFPVLAALISITGGLAGCASPASTDAMVARGIPNIQHCQKTVAVTAQGGSETGTMDSSNISNSDFAKAIETSIVENGVFTRIVPSNGSDYILNVSIVSMSKPLFGASFTVDMEAAWSLSNAVSKQVVMRESIKSSATATMGQALVGVTRLRLAVEGAAQENIRQGLMAISKLKLE
jgi:hypothetical protein